MIAAVSVTQNKLRLFESNDEIVPLKSTIGLVVVALGSKKDSVAMEGEKWMMRPDVVPLSMLVRVILFGVPLTTISTAVLYVPLDDVHDVNVALLRVICPPSPTVSSNTAPLPLFLTILVNSVEKVDGETEREFIEGTFVAEETEMSGEERRVIPLKETPLRVRDPVEETERKDDARGDECNLCDSCL